MTKGNGKLDISAERIGRLLGTVAGHVETWKQQRSAIEAEVRKFVRTSERLLRELGVGEPPAPAVRRRWSRGRPGRPKGYTMSEETKAKLRAAWARRKAAAAKAAGQR